MNNEKQDERKRLCHDRGIGTRLKWLSLGLYCRILVNMVLHLRRT